MYGTEQNVRFPWRTLYVPKFEDTFGRKLG
jgi:hypothetical protein